MEKEERLIFVDIAKGLGIVTVLFAHAGRGNIWIQPYYMPMFFALSGCIFIFLRKNIVDCFKSSIKMARLYFKYSIIVTAMYIPLFFIKHNNCLFFLRNLIGIFYARKAVYSPLDVENNIIFMEFGNGPMWFLPCLSIAWILFIPLEMLQHKIVFQTICVAIYILLGNCLSKLPIMLPWSFDTAFVAAIFILIGTKYECIREKYLLNFEGGGANGMARRRIWIMPSGVYYTDKKDIN